MYKQKFTVYIHIYVNIVNCTSNKSKNGRDLKKTGGSLITKCLLLEMLSVKAACMLFSV